MLEETKSMVEVYFYRNKYEIDCIADELKIEVKAGKPHRIYPKDVIVLDKSDLAKFLLKNKII